MTIKNALYIEKLSQSHVKTSEKLRIVKKNNVNNFNRTD